MLFARNLIGIGCAAALLVGANPAAADPVTYFFTSGVATVTADTSGGTSVVGPIQVALDGQSVTFDDMVPELTDILLTFPQSPLIPMNTPYGGFDQFVIESASISDGSGFMGPATQTSPGNWTFFAVPLDMDGTYTASDSTGTNPSVTANVPFQDDSAINGTINLSSMTLTLEGITLAILPGAAFGEAEDLIVKADITFGAIVPEPSSALLMGVGLLSLAARRRRR